MQEQEQILLFQTTDPVSVRKRLLRFREAFLRQGPHCRFAAVSYTASAKTTVNRIVLDGIEIEHHVYGPDAIDTLAYPVKGAARPFRLIPGNCDLVPLLFRRWHTQYAQYCIVVQRCNFPFPNSSPSTAKPVAAKARLSGWQKIIYAMSAAKK